MTNEELMKQFDGEDPDISEKLYLQNEAYIFSIAKNVARSYNCLRYNEAGTGYSQYTLGILEELKGEGALEFFRLLKLNEYDESKGKLTTYLHPFLEGVMRRWIETNIGVFSFDKTNMALTRKLRHDYLILDESVEDLAKKYGIHEELVARYLLYNTHTISIEDIPPIESDDPENMEILWKPQDGASSTSFEYSVYRRLCLHYLKELVALLPKKEKEIIMDHYGIFGAEKKPLDEIAIKHELTVDGVMKASKKIEKQLRELLPGSRLYWLREAYRMHRRAANSSF